MKIKSICVVETSADGDPTIHTFTADQTGRQQAKECFRAIARCQVSGAPSGIETPIFSDMAIESSDSLSHSDWSLSLILSEWRGVPTGSRMAE